MADILQNKTYMASRNPSQGRDGAGSSLLSGPSVSGVNQPTPPSTPNSMTSTGSSSSAWNANGMELGPAFEENGSVPTATQGVLMVGDIRYSQAEIKVMAGLLAQARRNGEFPATTASPTYAVAIVHDYHLLNGLREARGNPALPASVEYNSLQIEAARRIQQRDAELNDEAAQQEAIRRVNAYMRYVGHENHQFDVESTALQQQSEAGSLTLASFENATEEMVSTVEQTIADAMGPLRLNVRQLTGLNSAIETQIRMAERTSESQVEALRVITYAQAATTQSAAALTGSLSEITTGLSSLIINTVQMAVEQQVQQALRDMTAAHNRAITALHEAAKHVENQRLLDYLKQQIEHAEPPRGRGRTPLRQAWRRLRARGSREQQGLVPEYKRTACE